MRLGEFLRSAEISQTRFAAQIGVRQATISRYILGEQVPSVPIVVKIRDLSSGAVGLEWERCELRGSDWLPEKKIRRRDALLPGSELRPAGVVALGRTDRADGDQIIREY